VCAMLVHAIHARVFFLQAEGGIRDWSVTGVQTCALPIYSEPWRSPARRGRNRRGGVRPSTARRDRFAAIVRGGAAASFQAGVARSGERRVGEEGRWRWCADRFKEGRVERGSGGGGGGSVS